MTGYFIAVNQMSKRMQRILVIFYTALFTLSGCSAPVEDIIEVDPFIAETEGCNGFAYLCHRTYDNVTFPETHNAHATHEDGIYYPASNHATGLDAQWQAGMRAFMIDTHYATTSSSEAEDVRLCHGSSGNGYSPCIYGEVDAIEWLSALRSNMDESPRDVVTLLIESHVSAEHVFHVLNQTNLSSWMYTHTLNQKWPTLIELIQNETRLVVFWEQGEAEGYPVIHDFLVHSWTTDYSEENTDDMSCEVFRGDGEQPVWHLNNWLANSAGLSDPNRADETNDYDFLLNRTLDCWQFQDNRPTFIAVDWWEDGDVVAVTRTINNMSHWSDEITN